MKRGLRWFFYGFIGMLLIIATCDVFIEETTKSLVFDTIESVPPKSVALVLGTRFKYGNYMNPYFVYRMEAAATLYKAGKVKYIIVSGDNSRVDYDESSDMKEFLITLGVPANAIYLDYAGFRTLDSVVRCKKIFGQKDIIVVSQKFHNQRAAFIGKYRNVKVTGFNAKDVTKKSGLSVNIREKGARVKAVIDIVIGKDPKFLGPKIGIGEA